MKRRPELKPGDVCKISKRFRNSRNRKSTMIVKKIHSGDGVEMDSKIKCLVITGRLHSMTHTAIFKRSALWFTGYNQNDPETKQRPFSPTIHRTIEALKARAQPKATGGVCVCPDEVWMSSGCKCGAIKPYRP